MKNKLNIILCISIISLAVLFTGCRKDTFIDDKKNNEPDPTVTMVVDINGIILDAASMPIENVQIKVGNKTDQTDENGVFLLRQVAVNDAGTRLKAEKDGFFDQYRIVYPHITKEKLYVQLEMVEKGEANKFQSDSGEEILFNGGAKVSFPANSIVDNLGNPYNGEVSVYTHWFDPTDPNLAMSSPANLEGRNTAGDQVVLSTYGMVGVELESASGEKLQIGNDQLAELTFPIPNTLLADAPESIPLWSVDNTTGLWVQEFTAEKIGNEYVGTVNHFSFWNCDVPNDYINLEGYLKTADGTPVANKAILISEGPANSAVGYTSNAGYFEGKVPNDALLTMSVSSCDEVILETEIGPFSSDTDMGDVIVDLLIASTNVSAHLKGCVGEDLSGAYALLNGYQLLSADEDGMISGVYTACSNTTHAIKFYDGQNATVSDELNIDLSQTTNNYGMVTVCEQLGEFISFSVDGGDYWLIEDPESFIVNSNEISLIGANTTAGYAFRTTFGSASVGTYNSSETISYLPPDTGFPNGIYMSCTENINQNFPCDQFSVELLEIDLVNEIIAGTFEGYLLNSPDGGPGPEEVFVTGTFRSKITDQFNSGTINGRIWVDLNGNGMNDGSDEEEACVNILRLTRLSDAGQVQLGTVQSYPEDGLYSFTGIRPGTYKLSVFAINYDVTDYQIGDPAQDNDFQDISGNNSYETEYITIGDGEVINNIDLGIKAPDVVSAFIYSYGCAPNVGLSYVISGGLKPYSVQINSEPAIIVDGSGYIEVPTGGTYELTVTDALNNSSNNQVVALSYTNKVAGLLWEDKSGGTSGLFDSDVDDRISGTLVQLFDSSDQIINEMNSGDGGGYLFNDLPPGDYYIKTEIPAGLELSDLVDEDYYGNDILQTGLSPVFTISDCNENIRINAGYKAQ